MVCKRIAKLVLRVPPSLIEIHKRAELSMPLLVFLAEVLQRLRDPTVKFLERLAEYRQLRATMDRKGIKTAVQSFLSVTCQRDQDQVKTSGTKTKRELIFEELNQLVAYTKRLEFEIRRCLDTPLRLFRILLARHNSAPLNRSQASPASYQMIKDHYFQDDVKLDDIAKLMRFAQGMVGPLAFNSQGQVTAGGSINVEGPFVQNLNVGEFIHALQFFELQRNSAINQELMQQPLLRERLEELHPFDTVEFKEYHEKIKKLYAKTRQIYDFEAYDLDPTNNLRTKDIQELIDALKLQHEFIHETESLQKLYSALKQRLERFCNREFVQVGGAAVEFTVDEFENSGSFDS